MDGLDLPASVQQDPRLSRLLDSLKMESGPILAAATASHNTAADQAVQVNGHVANRIQYVFHLSIHTGGGCSTFSPHHPHQTGQMKSSANSKDRAVQVCTTSSRALNQQPACHLANIRVGHPATPMLIYNKKSSVDAQPDTILVTAAPNVQGNWIASRIVRRFGLNYQQDKTHRIAPLQSPDSNEEKKKTRLYVDLACGSMVQESPCKHRFFIVNHFAPDVLLGGRE